MEVLFYKLLKVDNIGDTVSVESFANEQNIRDYIMELLNNCVDSEGDREYIFNPTLQTTKNIIENIVNNIERNNSCLNLGRKLLDVEKEAAAKISHLGKEIQRGILMISFAKMTEIEYKIVITKADYTEFLEELSGDRKSGLPTKTKIFKSFIMNVSLSNNAFIYRKILTYDSNKSNKAIYWWKTFLELNEVRDDENNTILAFNAIKKEIIEPLRRQHKQDYLCLRNSTIAYFRTEGVFDLQHYKDQIIGTYMPFDNTLIIDNIKSKIERLPSKCNFDSIFTKIPNVITDKFKDVIKLTNDIELKLKQDILHISRIIQPKLDEEGNKYIMILSPDGYEYAEGLNRDHNE